MRILFKQFIRRQRLNHFFNRKAFFYQSIHNRRECSMILFNILNHRFTNRKSAIARLPCKLKICKSILISSSKSFGDIAKDYSDDTATKMNKGSLGVIDKTSSISSTYGSDVETKILALNEGETSEAIKGSDGYYFVTVTNTDKDTIKKSLKTVAECVQEMTA